MTVQIDEGLVFRWVWDSPNHSDRRESDRNPSLDAPSSTDCVKGHHDG
jgi:hypothetical protein